MSVTVADCLKLPSLREATVLAGHKGLNKIVSSVTVLEYADFSALEDAQFWLGNEMIISALCSIKDDVEAQCKLIQLLHDMGEACIVLYYVGIYMPAVDQKLTALANELDFPLLMMPPNRYGHRYSDAILEVMNAIFNDQRQEANIVTGILEQIAHVHPHKRNIGTVMRMLSDRLRCSLLLVDRNGDIRAFAPWPLAAGWDESDLKLALGEARFGESIALSLKGRETRLHSMTLDMEKQKGLRLLAIDESGNVNPAYMCQTAEALQLFANIWKGEFEDEGTEALVRAMLTNQPTEMRRIARQLCVNTEAFNTLWILWNKDAPSGADMKNRKDLAATKMTSFLKEHHCTALVDVFQAYVVAFLNAARYADQEMLLAKQFMEEHKRRAPNDVLLVIPRLSTTEELCAAFLKVEENIEAACRIYPFLNALTRHELSFAAKCRDILNRGEVEIQKHMILIEPFLCDEPGIETVETLKTLLLDCQGSVVETSSRLHIHKNTVKYRIKKAKSMIGFDAAKIPEMMELYVALALHRLLH